MIAYRVAFSRTGSLVFSPLPRRDIHFLGQEVGDYIPSEGHFDFRPGLFSRPVIISVYRSQFGIFLEDSGMGLTIYSNISR